MTLEHTHDTFGHDTFVSKGGRPAWEVSGTSHWCQQLSANDGATPLAPHRGTTPGLDRLTIGVPEPLQPLFRHGHGSHPVHGDERIAGSGPSESNSLTQWGPVGRDGLNFPVPNHCGKGLSRPERCT